ncbi:astroprincin family protein [Sphingobacterium bovisgrunnientis]|uniref:astroprincin family protein n=1 Tax=Sphingobacterium bovisgrunnientis TaxID=1874697 RepID=UPI00135B6EA3|nr:astroprincin family protein [Sphingobacterium bovisgrunnientis]
MKISTKYILIALIAIISATFYTCKNPFNGIEIITDGDLYGNSPTGVVFINANELNPTPVGDFNVTISGQDAGKVMNDLGKKDFKVVGGILSLVLEDGVKPTKANPIQFHISGELTGYVPISQTITLDHDSVSVFVVRMVQYRNLPEGTAAVVANNTTLAAGATTATKTITLPSSATKPEQTNIVLQTGTQFLTESGAPISGGTLTSNIVQYSASSPKALEAFPGGLSAQNLVDANGSKINAGSFVTAGFVAIDMKVGNQAVKKFSKPLKIDMELSSQIINPTTGVAIKAGDQIPVWSLDESKGVWQREGMSTVATNNGKLMASFDVPHLSYWSLNFFTQNCTQDTRLTINANAAAANRQFGLRIVNQSGQPVSTAEDLTYTMKSGANTITLTNMPNYSVKAEVYDKATGQKAAESAFFNPCSNQGVAITLNASSDDIVNVVLDLIGKCPSKKAQVLPSSNIPLYKINTQGQKEFVQSVRVTNGKGELKLINNTKYFLEVSFDGKKKSSEFNFNKSDTKLPAQNGLTGNVTYNSGTNTATLKAEFVIPNCN